MGGILAMTGLAGTDGNAKKEETEMGANERLISQLLEAIEKEKKKGNSYEVERLKQKLNDALRLIR